MAMVHCMLVNMAPMGLICVKLNQLSFTVMVRE